MRGDRGALASGARTALGGADPLPLLPWTPFSSHPSPGAGVREGKGVDARSQEALK